MAQTDSHRIVITVLGKNRAGIVAAISKILGEANVDIRDITQSIIEDIFTMTMLADMSESPMDFTALQEALAAGGEAGGRHHHPARGRLQLHVSTLVALRDLDAAPSPRTAPAAPRHRRIPCE